MMRIAVLIVAALPLGACATINQEPFGNIAAQQRANDQYYRKVGIAAQAKIDRLRAAGAMNKWDRLENQAYHDYLDAKYGESTDPQ